MAFLWSELAYFAVYAIFWFATATDVAVQIGEYDDAYWGASLGAGRAFVAFAFFACFQTVGGCAVAALALRRAPAN